MTEDSEPTISAPDSVPVDTKLTTTKQRWAREGKFLTGRIARPESDRLPPGQHLVKDWPVLDLGEQPKIPLDHWPWASPGLIAVSLAVAWAA